MPFPTRLVPANNGEALEEIRRPKLLLSRGVGRLTKLVLFPVRLLYTAETGRVGANDAAVEHYLAADTAPPGASLVAAAIAWRTVPPDNDGAVLIASRVRDQTALPPLHRRPTGSPRISRPPRPG